MCTSVLQEQNVCFIWDEHKSIFICASCSYLCDEADVPMPAGVVVTLARKYRVSLPVLTAVAQVLNGHLNAKEAVYEIMNLPQIEER